MTPSFWSDLAVQKKMLSEIGDIAKEPV